MREMEVIERCRLRNKLWGHIQTPTPGVPFLRGISAATQKFRVALDEVWKIGVSNAIEKKK